jgi:VWFA-related protein
VRFSILTLAMAVVLQGQEPLPRFRAGANLVTVDAYFSKSGAAVTDLQQDDVEILEDGSPQTIESFRIVRARPQTAAAATRPAAPAATTASVDSDASRIFVLFLDTWHVSKDGSFRAGAPVSTLVERVIGVNDLVGLMTPEMNASGLDLTGRAAGIERLMRESTLWGQRDTIGDVDPREHDITLCYPDNDAQRPQFRGIAKEMIERRREKKTLDALGDLIDHLGTLDDERKFVVLLTEGWVLFRQDESLGRILEKDYVPTGPKVGSGSQGLARPEGYDRGFASCERERSLLAFLDHGMELRRIAQRANRANVTFYAIDPRGLTAFDDSIGPLTPASPVADRVRLSSRQEGLRELALNTDGAVVLNSNDMKAGVARMMNDLSSYYLMQYYSTNTKPDGRFRQITVRVKRPGVQVRARPGYLALTSEEMRSLTAAAAPPVLPPGAELIKRRLPMIALRRGPSTGLDYVKVEQAQLRRTERLRIELELPDGAANVAGKVLTNQHQELQMPVVYSTTQSNGQTISRLEVILAPLAPAPYLLRTTYELNGQKESNDYEIRIVP